MRGVAKVVALGAAALLIVALGATGFATAQKSGAKVSTVTSKAKRTSPGGDRVAGTASCGKHKIVTGADILIGKDAGTSATVTNTYRKGKRTWKATARDSSNTISGTISARCLKLAGAKIKVASKKFALEDNSNRYGTVKCPGGMPVVGGGVKAPGSNNYRQGSFPSGKSEWTAGVYYTSGGDTPKGTVYAYCLKVPGTKVKVKRVIKKAKQKAGEMTRLKAKCPKGTKVVGGGLRVKHPNVDYDRGSSPVGKRAWVAQSRTPSGEADSQLSAYALCLK